MIRSATGGLPYCFVLTAGVVVACLLVRLLCQPSAGLAGSGVRIFDGLGSFHPLPLGMAAGLPWGLRLHDCAAYGKRRYHPPVSTPLPQPKAGCLGPNPALCGPGPLKPTQELRIHGCCAHLSPAPAPTVDH